MLLHILSRARGYHGERASLESWEDETWNLRYLRIKELPHLLQCLPSFRKRLVKKNFPNILITPSIEKGIKDIGHWGIEVGHIVLYLYRSR